MSEREDLITLINEDVQEIVGHRGRPEDGAELGGEAGVAAGVHLYTYEEDLLAGDIDPGEGGKTQVGISKLNPSQFIGVFRPDKSEEAGYEWTVYGEIEGRNRAWKKVGGKILSVTYSDSENEEILRTTTLPGLRRLAFRVRAARDSLYETI